MFMEILGKIQEESTANKECFQAVPVLNEGDLPRYLVGIGGLDVCWCVCVGLEYEGAKEAMQNELQFYPGEMCWEPELEGPGCEEKGLGFSKF